MPKRSITIPHRSAKNVFTLSKLMGAQWKQAGREINSHKKDQRVVKLVRD
jgi:hypothetical protein